MGFGFFNIMEFIFPLFFIGFFVVFAVILFRSLKQWNRNNHSPRLTVEATVVGRRSHRSGGGRDTAAHTSYYITFQVESGDRMELHVPYSEYGYIVEGDRGKLTFQGTRFLSFERSL